VNDARFYFFEPVRFFADVDYSFDPHVSSAQQPDGLLATWLSLCIRALRAEMEFVLTQNLAVSLYTRDASTAVKSRRRYLIQLSRILVDPWQVNPALGIGHVGRNQMKLFRINVGWIPELVLHGTTTSSRMALSGCDTCHD